MGKKLFLSGFALGILLFGVGFVGIFTSDKLIQGLVKSVKYNILYYFKIE